MTSFFVSVAPHPKRGTPGPHYYSWIYGRSPERPQPAPCSICGDPGASQFISREVGDDTLTAFWCAACVEHEGLRAVSDRVDQIINAVTAASKTPHRDYLLRKT